MALAKALPANESLTALKVNDYIDNIPINPANESLTVLMVNDYIDNVPINFL